MPVSKDKYKRLPYLDAVNQVRVYCGITNKLKIPLRNAVNACRTNDDNMRELLALLEETLAHIKQLDKPKTRKKKKVVETEYELPN
jgi:hypothetical protein